MSNTAIQIKRSTTTSIPPSLEAGELAFTSNGNSLWIGSPAGSNTANVIHVGSRISYFANSTQVGTEVSNTELASTFAIKKFVDDKLNAYSTDLSGLDDVTITSPANNDLLIYDGTAGIWENHSIGGTANEIEVTFSNNNIVIGITNTVTMNTVSVTGNAVFNGTVNTFGEAHFFEVVHINREYPGHIVHYISNPTLIATVNTNSFGQVAMQNFSNGENSSADFVAYPNNARVDDNSGFIDMGITGNNFAQAAYSVTGPNDGYIFMSSRAGDNLPGSLVLATDSTGTNNDIKFFVGGFTFNANEAHMILTGNTRSLGLGNTNPLHKISVNGTAYFGGDTTIIGTANASSGVNVGANVNLSTSDIKVGNSTVNTQLAASTLSLNGSSARIHVGNSTVNTVITAGNITTNGNITATGTANVATAINVGANVNFTTSGINVGNSTVNSSITATAVNLDGTLSAGNTTINGTLAAGNTTITGDLTVTGTVTTVDTVNLVIEDSLIRLARNQANTGTFTDSMDIGFYGVYGNTSSVRYAGLARESASNNFVLFVDKSTSPDNDGVETSDSLGTLFAYINAGGLISNSTNIALTANSSLDVAIVANTLSLSTALAVSSGGTGRASLTNNAVIVGNGTGQVTQVSSSTEGHVLQINSSGAPTFGVLDGGTF